MCDFKFTDFTPDEIIKIIERDINQYQRKHDYHMGLAKTFGLKIEELETKVGKIRQKIRREKKDWSKNLFFGFLL